MLYQWKKQKHHFGGYSSCLEWPWTVQRDQCSLTMTITQNFQSELKVKDWLVTYVNIILQKLYDCCCRNCPIPHPGKSDYMILKWGQFARPLQAVSLGNSVVTQVKSTRCFGIDIDSDLIWNVHVKELFKSFSQKLNLLRSRYFLPTTARADFHFKVILPSVTYGLFVWGSCGKSLFHELEKIHVCAAKIICGLDWYIPSDQVLAQSKWPTVEDLYEYRLLMSAHDCFYNFSAIPVMKLFMKYECNYNLRRKLTFFLPKPNTEVLWESSSYKAVSLWNSLDNHTRAISSKSLIIYKLS